MFNLIVLKGARKELEKIPKEARDRIFASFRGIVANPFLGKPLRGGHKGQYSWRVWPYRIIYEIRKQELVIIVITIGHRQRVYG